MKTIVTAAALFAATSTTAMAADWENTTVGVNMISGPLDFSIDADEDGLTDLEVGYTTLEHSFGNVNADLRFALGTNMRGTDTMTALGQYNMSMLAAESFTVYGTAEVAYTATTDFDNEVWTFNPYAGVSYAITDNLDVYGEVGYSWDMSDDFDQEGGYVEIGMPIHATTSMTITPSVSRTFDVPVEATDFRLETTFRF